MNKLRTLTLAANVLFWLIGILSAKLANGETKDAYLFAEPLTEIKVEVVEDVATAEQLIADEDELLIRFSKGMKRLHIDKALNRIFKNTLNLKRVGRHVSQAVPILATTYQSQSLSIAFKQPLRCMTWLNKQRLMAQKWITMRWRSK